MMYINAFNALLTWIKLFKFLNYFVRRKLLFCCSFLPGLLNYFVSYT